MDFIFGFFSSTVLMSLLCYLLKNVIETRLNESVKAEYNEKLEEFKRKIKNEDRVEELRWKTTHEACLDALGVIDAYFSVVLLSPEGKKPTFQPIEITKARECHSKLLLACKNTNIVSKFNEILFLNNDDENGAFIRPPTDLLNEFRNEIRLELGFGCKIPYDRNVAWIGNMAAEKKDGT